MEESFKFFGLATCNDSQIHLHGFEFRSKIDGTSKLSFNGGPS